MILSFKAVKAPLDAGLVELDFDPAAERYCVLDRLSLSALWVGPVPASGTARVLVPVSYTTIFNLMVLIIDDAGDPLYYVTGNDKVQAQLVDANTVILNP